ncbi:MAG: hypothetical protein JWN14_1344 [Chthonomonadales bacterium]|nr:hypothetical protein [Chthonomonadales bacterium]
MIGYGKTRVELEALITAKRKRWLRQTGDRTEEFRKNGCYEEESSLWGQVKEVYMQLQGGSKCAYCERKLEAVHYGKGEQAVDHFRPKGNVSAWPVPEEMVPLEIPFTAPPPAKKGYYLLVYHPFNYAAACNPCNSILKSDYFPIAGSYRFDGDDPAQLRDEHPYLIYPIGDFDSPPETLIEFYGITPRAVAAEGHDQHRALVTISFFHLGDADGRKNLFLERARLLIALFPQLEKMRQPASRQEQETARSLIESFTRPDTPHTNCCRSFVKLYGQSPLEARTRFHEAVELVSNSS